MQLSTCAYVNINTLVKYRMYTFEFYVADMWHITIIMMTFISNFLCCGSANSFLKPSIVFDQTRILHQMFYNTYFYFIVSISINIFMLLCDAFAFNDWKSWLAVTIISSL